jgi:hypothetical protein
VVVLWLLASAGCEGVRSDPLAGPAADGAVAADAGPDAPDPRDQGPADAPDPPDQAAADALALEADAPPDAAGSCRAQGCPGDCQACAEAGDTCVSVAGAPIDPAACGRRQACDGQGACRKLFAQPCAENAHCLSESCVGGFCTCTLCLRPEFWDFGTVPQEMTGVYYFKVRNARNVMEAPFEVMLAPVGDRIFFFGDHTCGRAGLAPGEECDLQVWFRPDAEMSYATNLELRREGAVLARASLGGEGLSGARPFLRNNGLYLGAAPVGSATRAFPFELVNPIFGAEITPTTFTIEGRNRLDFEVSTNECPPTLQKGTECGFFVQFAPKTRGELTATVVVSGEGFRASVGVHGTGL